MTKKKLIKEIEKRIDALERDFNSFLSAFLDKNSQGQDVSYEEVIDQWLNGTKER